MIYADIIFYHIELFRIFEDLQSHLMAPLCPAEGIRPITLKFIVSFIISVAAGTGSIFYHFQNSVWWQQPTEKCFNFPPSCKEITHCGWSSLLTYIRVNQFNAFCNWKRGSHTSHIHQTLFPLNNSHFQKFLWWRMNSKMFSVRICIPGKTIKYRKTN